MCATLSSAVMLVSLQKRHCSGIKSGTVGVFERLSTVDSLKSGTKPESRIFNVFRCRVCVPESLSPSDPHEGGGVTGRLGSAI